jgi:hypothetical protein
MRISDDSQKEYFSSLVASLRSSGDITTVDLLKKAFPELIDTRYDNWNSGTWFYKLFIYIKLSDYNQLTNEVREKHEGVIFGAYSNLFSDESDVLETVEIKPLIEQQLDWAALKGKETKQSIINRLNREKEYLISSGTGKTRIQDCDKDYIALHLDTKNVLSELMLEHPLDYRTLWDWYHYYSENLSTYRERRKYINETFANVIDMISKSDEIQNDLLKYEPTGWEKIDYSVNLLSTQLVNISDSIDFNQIGLRCRETIILLAKEVYKEPLHHPSSYKDKISRTDSSRMLQGYIEYHFKGQSNDEKRRYAKVTNDLANNLTHKKNATLLDAKLCLSATLSLISIIKIINDEISLEANITESRTREDN